MMILLTGGSGCGKSTYAESMLARLPAPRYYVAAMRPYSEECLKKAEKHQAARRLAGVETVERYTDLSGLTLPERGSALLECVCNLTSNEMFDGEGKSRDPFDRVISGVAALERQCGALIVVTNDVGSGKAGYDRDTEDYIRALGAVNAALAERADAVYELVCGIPITIKGELPCFSPVTDF